MELFFIKRSDGQWVNKSYKRLSDAKNKISRQCRYYEFYRNATIYKIDISKNAVPVITASHSISTRTYTDYSGNERTVEDVVTSYNKANETINLQNQNIEDLSNI